MKILIFLFLALPVLATPKFKPGIMSAAEGGFDYAIQGEYSSETYGVQVISLGKNFFQAVIYSGGLPGAGWNSLDKWTLDGQKDSTKVVFKKTAKKKKYLARGTAFSAVDQEVQPDWQAEADGQQFKLHIGSKEVLAKKVHRQSPSLGQAPPIGAKVLLPYKKNQKPDLSHWDNPHWQALDDGSMLVVVPEKKELKFSTCDISFGDKSYHLHLEFKTSFMPESRSQGRANSGVFPPTGLEVQVLDSFGLVGKNNEAGGLYKKAAPAVNMCFPPLSWQTYDIYFHKGAEGEDSYYRILHNGVEIHKKELLNNPQMGQLRLQDHLNSVFFRNIWVF